MPRNEDDPLKVESIPRPQGTAAPEVIERARLHLSQFKAPNVSVKGFLFVDDAWIARRIKNEHYQLETDPEVIAHVAETWVDHGIPDSIGTMYSPCDARPHCVIAPYQ